MGLADPRGDVERLDLTAAERDMITSGTPAKLLRLE
jgi:hypothetical protein